MRSFLIALALAGWLPGVAGAELPHAARTAIDRYRALIASAGSDSSSGNIEEAFAALRGVARILLEDRNAPSLLETMSDADYLHVQQELVGAFIFREESVFVLPDPDFFVDLAAAHGDDADRAFFGAYKATYPPGCWPVYDEQQTDYSGCTRFGSMALVDTYGSWADFRRRYPGRYASDAGQELEDVLEELTRSTCACGDLADVERELRAFVQRFPGSADRPAVQERLDAVLDGRVKIREHCASG